MHHAVTTSMIRCALCYTPVVRACEHTLHIGRGASSLQVLYAACTLRAKPVAHPQRGVFIAGTLLCTHASRCNQRTKTERHQKTGPLCPTHTSAGLLHNGRWSSSLHVLVFEAGPLHNVRGVCIASRPQITHTSIRDRCTTTEGASSLPVLYGSLTFKGGAIAQRTNGVFLAGSLCCTRTSNWGRCASNVGVFIPNPRCCTRLPTLDPCTSRGNGGGVIQCLSSSLHTRCDAWSACLGLDAHDMRLALPWTEK